MRGESVTRLGLAVGLIGVSQTLSVASMIASAAVIAILVFSAITLQLQDRLQGRLGRMFVRWSSYHVNCTAFGFGLCLAGTHVLPSSWGLLGILMLLVGVLLIWLDILRNVSLAITAIKASA